MNSATATQADTPQQRDARSLAGGIDCSVDLDGTPLTFLARQEDKEAADVNNILQRFGVNAPQRPVVYGDADWTIDLQTAMESVRESQRAFNRLPQELRAKYGTYDVMLKAAADGTLKADLAALDEAKAQQALDRRLDEEETIANRKTSRDRDRKAKAFREDLEKKPSPKEDKTEPTK